MFSFSQKRLDLHSSNKKNGLKRKEPTKIRHIILVRHGQYRDDKEITDDAKKVLTPLGRKQADLTGKRIAEIVKNLDGQAKFKAIHVSNLTRAKETADIIASHLPGIPRNKPDMRLNEVPPSILLGQTGGHFLTDKAFSKLFYRASPNKKGDDIEHEFELVVGHANVIRYFVCHALSIPVESWVRFVICNCSITYLVVHANGVTTCRHVGDGGHLGAENISFSQKDEGYTWG